MSARARVGSTATRLRQTVAGGLGLLLAVGVLGVFSPTAALADSAPLADSPATPATVTADALPTVQINGVVWSQVVVGNTVYAAGKFTRARPAGAAAGTSETVRNNLLAYDIRTGELITSFAPDLNGQALVVTASPDGSRIYVGGDFTKANGQARSRIAAYDTATGALVTTFKPSVTGQVRAIAATNSTVYLGGGISAVGTVARSRLAAVSAAAGALLAWAPKPGAGPTTGNRQPIFKNGVATSTLDTAHNKLTSTDVLALVLTNGGTQVVAAGRFDTLNGVKATGVGALDAATGATRTFAVNQLITNQGVNSAVYSLSTDGTTVYGTGYDYYGPGNLESTFAATATDGTVRWISDCRGDTYSSFPTSGVVYLSSHAHDCANIGGYSDSDPRTFRYATALSQAATGTNARFSVLRGDTAFAGKAAPSLLDWFPTLASGTYTGQLQAGWSVSGNAQYVVYGGEFPKVNGTGQQGLVRFAVRAIAPNKMGPSSGGLTPTVVALDAMTARVSWLASTDQDNENLIYRVYRDGNTTTPVYTVTAASTWWDRPTLAFVDKDVAAGSHSYLVTATDPTGRRATGSSASVTVPAGTPTTRAYAQSVLADGAEDYWPLGKAPGSVGLDNAGGLDLTVGSGVTPGRSGAITGDGNTGVTLSGTATGVLATQTAGLAPNAFSVEGWFSTTTTAGGKLIGFGNKSSGLSTQYDRQVYMTTTGQLSFGVYDGAKQVVSSAGKYNDGAWHHVVATLSDNGMALYVDGKRVGSRAETTFGQPTTGYWRVGGDATWSGAQYFAGQVDEVAVYPTALSADVVAAHHTLGTSGVATNTSPTAAFTTSATGLTAGLDASGSTDRDGTVASYAWTFGDGSTGSGKTASHTYDAAGTYPVTLTVTDDDGATGTVTRSVTVTAPVPNAAPTAAFTSAVTGLAASLDGSSSADPDGTPVSWTWDFGDGAAASGVTASHAYATAGTYTVELTVADDDGATDSVTHQVTVAAPASSDVIASDTFSRTVTGGLGTADVGGSWTATAGAARQSVAGGMAQLALNAAGQNTGSFLSGVSQVSADVRTSVTVTDAPTGSGTYVYVSARRIAGVGEYRVRLRFLTDGRVALTLSRLTGSTETFPGGEVVVPGLTYVPGTALDVRVQAAGTGTTQVEATVWAAGTTEPATATITRADTTAALQVPGGIGVAAYLPSGTTAGTSVRFSPITVTAAP